MTSFLPAPAPSPFSPILHSSWRRSANTLANSSVGMLSLEEKPKSPYVALSSGLSLCPSLSPAPHGGSTPARAPFPPGLRLCISPPASETILPHPPLHMASSFKSQRNHAASVKPFQTPQDMARSPDLHYQRALCPSSEHACSVEYAKGLAHSRFPLKVMTLVDTGHRRLHLNLNNRKPCGSQQVDLLKLPTVLDPHQSTRQAWLLCLHHCQSTLAIGSTAILHPHGHSIPPRHTWTGPKEMVNVRSGSYPFQIPIP